MQCAIVSQSLTSTSPQPKMFKCRSQFEVMMGAKSTLRFCRLLLLLSSGSLNIFQVELDQRRHLGRLPIGLFGFLWPRKREMPDFSRLFGPFKHFKGFQKDLPLTFSVSNLPDGSPVRVLNGRRPGDADRPMKFISGCKNNG